MEIPEIPDDLRGIERVRVVGDALQEAKQLQTFIDSVDNYDKKVELTLPIIESINNSWELKGREVLLYGQILGPDKDNVDTITWHESVSGFHPKFNYLYLSLDGQRRFMITIHVQDMLREGEPTNPLTGPLLRRLDYHAPVDRHPEILSLAS